MPPKRKQAPQEEPSEDSGSEEEPYEDSGSEPSSDDSSDSGPSASEDDGMSEESEDDEDGEAFDSINVDFEFFGPQEKDFHGLKTLLHTYLDGEEYDCSGLVDAIIRQGQTGVGTVIKCGEEEDPIGVCTVFSLRRESGLKSLGELRGFLLAHCPEGGPKEALEKAWGAPGTGLVVSERLINCPPQLAPPLAQNLFEEIAAEAEDGESQEVREAFSFKRYILVVRAYVDPAQQTQQPAAQQPQKKGKKQRQQQQQQQQAAAPSPSLVYATPEAECFHAHAAWSFTFPTPNRLVSKGDPVPHRLVMGVEASKVPKVLKELEALVAAGGSTGA